MTSTQAPIPGRLWLIAALVGAGAFMAMLDATLVNLAVAPVGTDLTAPLASVQWIITGYLIAMAMSLPLTGWLGRRCGYGRLWCLALLVFVLASAACALAGELATLIAFRVVQGLAAGLMVPAGQAVLGAAAGPAQLGRLMGALGVVVSLGPALGPAFGGLLLEQMSWRWLFGINVPLGALALWLARRHVPAGERDSSRAPDWPGLVLLGLGLPLLLGGATALGEPGRGAWAAAGAGLLLCGLFACVALRRRHPLIDLSLLAAPRFALATLTTAFTGASLYGALFLLPLYLQQGYGYAASSIGLWLLVMGLGSAAALYVGGALTDRLGAAPVIVSGAVLLMLSTLPFLGEAPLPPWLLAVCLVTRGIGVALAQMPAMTAAYAVVTREQVGDAATLVNIVQRIGGALGAAALVVVLVDVMTPARPADYRVAFAVLLVAALVAMVAGLLLWRYRSTAQA